MQDSPKSITLLSLLAVILTTGTFKEEMTKMYLWSGSWSLLNVFIAFSLFYGLLLLCYLILEYSPETPGFKFLMKHSKPIRTVLNSIFLLSLTLILLFSIAALVLAALAFAPHIITIIIYIIGIPLIYKQIVGLVREIKTLLKIIKKNRGKA